jgi:hypothetical protein
MADPATKDNLESQDFLSTSRAVQDRLTSCLRSDAAHIRPFSQASEAIEAIKQGLNRVQPRNPGMKKITDPTNEFGQSMLDAVLAYKSFNGIIRTGQKLDPIVGRMTLAQLDTELKNLGKPVDPTPPKLEFGSNNWRFSFIGNKGLFGKGIFSLFIGSAEVRDDSQNFDIDEVSSSGTLLPSGFQGASRGTFSTLKKMNAKDFDSAVCDMSVTRNSKTLQGTIRLQKFIGSDLFTVFFLLPGFREENVALTDGTVIVRGQLHKDNPRPDGVPPVADEG